MLIEYLVFVGMGDKMLVVCYYLLMVIKVFDDVEVIVCYENILMVIYY